MLAFGRMQVYVVEIEITYL